MLGVAPPPSSTPELDLKYFTILRDFCYQGMTLPEAEVLLRKVSFDGSEVYDDSRWRPWLTQINDSEDDSPEKLDVAQQVETEITALTHLISGGAVSCTPSSPHLHASEVFDLSAFGDDSMEVDVDFGIPNTHSQSSPTHVTAASSSSNSLSSDLPLSDHPSSNSPPPNPPKIKLSLKEFVARKKQHEADGKQSSLPPIPAPVAGIDLPSNPLPRPSTVPSTSKNNKPPLRSFDGRVGALFPNIGLFVTTPNMDIVYAPLGQCKTRLRRTNHYGQDDPLIWPQPFDSLAGHLAAIPSPHVSEQQPLYWAWYQPISTDFEPFPFAGLDGMVCLSDFLQERMIKMCTMVSETIAKLPGDLPHDSLLIRDRDQLRKYLERLGEPGPTNLVSLQLACLQRVVIELYARAHWLEKWIPRFRNIDSSYDLDCTVMGAFTGDLDVASDLFRVGMPVWLIRPLEKQALTRIDRIVAPYTESSNHQLPIRDSEQFLDISDCDPPHPTIYTGLPGHYKRYFRMTNYIKQQFNSAVVGNFENEIAVTPGSSLLQHVASVVTSPTGNASRNRVQHHSTSVLAWLDVTSRDWVSVPQTKKRAKQAGSFDVQERNRFLAIIHDAFPIRLTWWDRPCVQLQELQRISGQSQLGHPLPDPCLFLTSSNQLKTERLLMWLRLRPLFLWRLGIRNAKLYGNKDWRAMLEIAEGRHVAGNKHRAQMTQYLEAVVTDSGSTGIVLNTQHLTGAPALWNGREVEVDSSGQLNLKIVQEIVWELYEAKFRSEMFLIDRKMVPEPVGHDDQAEMAREIWYGRELLVHRCWPGLAHRPMYNQPGFSSSNSLVSRVPFVKGLFDLVRGWPGPKPVELRQPFPAEADLSAVWAVEEILASYYIRTFLKCFQRPPTLPHVANTN